ncbi:conserved hypothetical protein [Coccidioides posadasii str. Silveira]|uniref:Uncharacterized protein n=1 Tax=Coccidioides posadasii (strain RMSCC 757 / Silveira) TaxID=443226 RepID=E9CS60_COCPS|nr:conserved hypothetical protein [Coccidioides posadasii str. Silveira]
MGQALRRQWDHKTRNHFYWISAAEYRPCCQSLRKEVKRWHLPYGSGRPSVCPYRIACCGNCSQHPNFNSCDLIRCPDQQMQFETHYVCTKYTMYTYAPDKEWSRFDMQCNAGDAPNVICMQK